MRPSVKTWIVIAGVTAVLLFFLAAPLAAIMYGGAAAGIAGAILLAPLVVVQGLIFFLFRRHFPKVSLGKPEEESEYSSLEPDAIQPGQGEPGVGADSR